MKTTAQSGFHAVEVLIVLAICGLLAAIAIPNFQKACKNQQERYQTARTEGYGHPATEEQLAIGEVYEVVAVWTEPTPKPITSVDDYIGTAPKHYYTLLRDKDEHILLFSLHDERAPGFYRFTQNRLVALQPATLEKR